MGFCNDQRMKGKATKKEKRRDTLNFSLVLRPATILGPLSTRLKPLSLGTIHQMLQHLLVYGEDCSIPLLLAIICLILPHCNTTIITYAEGNELRIRLRSFFFLRVAIVR